MFGFPNLIGKKIFANHTVRNVKHSTDVIDFFCREHILALDFFAQGAFVLSDGICQLRLRESALFNSAEQLRVIGHFFSPFLAFIVVTSSDFRTS
jgi:hypothetical protein